MVQLIICKSKSIPNFWKMVKYFQQLVWTNDIVHPKLSLWGVYKLTYLCFIGRLIVVNTTNSRSKVSRKYFDLAEKGYFHDLNVNIIHINDNYKIDQTRFSHYHDIYYRIFDAKANKNESVIESMIYVAKRKDIVL